MSRHAVVIAGDFRTFEHSIHSAADLLRDCDVYVSVWDRSKFMHTVTRKVHLMGRFNADVINTIPCKSIALTTEEYDPTAWRHKGYNANYIDRLQAGADLIRESGMQYDTILFMRPDLFFNKNQTELFKCFVDELTPGTFLTNLSDVDRVEKLGTLNDMMFAVHGSDLDKVLPTVDGYQPHKHEDWHTFWCSFVKRQGFAIRNFEGFAELYVVLRPPVFADVMTFADAVRNSDAWNDQYILHAINMEGVRVAVRSWGKRAVIRAIENLEDGPPPTV